MFLSFHHPIKMKFSCIHYTTDPAKIIHWQSNRSTIIMLHFTLITNNSGIWDNLLVYVRFCYLFLIRIITKHFLLYDRYCIIIIVWIITTIWKVIRISYRKYEFGRGILKTVKRKHGLKILYAERSDEFFFDKAVCCVADIVVNANVNAVVSHGIVISHVMHIVEPLLFYL